MVIYECLKIQPKEGTKAMNKKMLESKMKLFGDTNATLAQAIGISQQSLSSKKNETRGAEFTQGEIAAIKQRYTLSAGEVDDIFFAKEVS